jgi:hypothetical protein
MVWFLFMNLWPKCGGKRLCMHDWLWCLIMYATTLKENIGNLMAWGVRLLHYLTEIPNFCVYCVFSFWRFEIQNLCNILCPIKVNNLKPCSGKHSWGNIRVRPCQIICSYRIQQFLVIKTASTPECGDVWTDLSIWCGNVTLHIRQRRSQGWGRGTRPPLAKFWAPPDKMYCIKKGILDYIASCCQ